MNPDLLPILHVAMCGARHLHRQRGLSMVFAVFLLVALSALGAFMMSVVSQTQIGRAQDTLGYQAREAAVAGVEYGVYRFVQGGACGSETLIVGNYQVVVACTPSDTTTSNDVGGTAMMVRRIAATACPSGGACPETSAPGFGYVERRIEAVVAK
jgi:MSHA biogenesis protein MshP